MLSMLEHWPADVPFSVDAFGSPQCFLDFVRICYDSGSGLDVLEAKLEACIKGNDVELINHLSEYALAQLDKAVRVEEAQLTRTAIKKVVESPHPYQDNMDKYYKVSIPGAKYIELVFDDRCAFENNCDYVQAWRVENGNRQQQVGEKLAHKRYNCKTSVSFERLGDRLGS